MRDLWVHHGAITAVRGINLEISGGFTNLVGPNGAGKTSLMSAIAGIVPARGTVSIGDLDVSSLVPEKRAEAGLAFVPEGRRLFGRSTVKQNLIVGAARLPRRQVDSRVEAMLNRFPFLAERSVQRADTLSGGEGQLLMIARALIAEPSVLLVDEPFQGLSQEASENVLGALVEAASTGTAVIVASPEAIGEATVIEFDSGRIAEAIK